LFSLWLLLPIKDDDDVYAYKNFTSQNIAKVCKELLVDRVRIHKIVEIKKSK